MTPAVTQFLKRAPDTEASSLALRAIDTMEKGATISGAYLAKAWEANVAAAKDLSSTAKMRRASLAQQAYDARISSEKGRMMAAYAVMATREGGKAISAQQAMAQARDARQKDVLVQQAKFASLRRNVMLQAAETAAKSFKAPALPPLLNQSAKGNEQVTLNLQSEWRPPGYVQRTNLFFPDDVRVAAAVSGAAQGSGAVAGLGSLANLGAENWWDSFTQYQTEGVLAGLREADREVEKVVSQEPGSAAVAADAKLLMESLKPGQVAAAQAEQKTLPWWVLPVGIATVYYVLS